MKGRERRTCGLTLIEMTLVVGTIALLVGFAVPAVRALVHSFQSQSGTKSMVSSALSAARAMAMSRQRYVGVRFQKLCTSDDVTTPLAGLLDAPQYMIFVLHDDKRNMGHMAKGFRALEGMEPIKLPSTIGVLDLAWLRDALSEVSDPSGRAAEPASWLNDGLTFSIVFSPAGRLVVRPVRVRNRDGVHRPISVSDSRDDVFNSPENICVSGRGRFIQDDYPEYGLDEENSRQAFVIYEVPRLRTAYEQPLLWAAYLSELEDEDIYVSPYAGDLISSQ